MWGHGYIALHVNVLGPSTLKRSITTMLVVKLISAPNGGIPLQMVTYYIILTFFGMWTHGAGILKTWPNCITQAHPITQNQERMHRALLPKYISSACT